MDKLTNAKRRLACLLVAVLFALAIGGCSTNTNAVDESESNAGRFDSEAGVVYIITDTKTGVQYLAWKYGHGAGVCALVDADGKPILAGDDK